MKKLLILSTLLAAGVAMADTYDWSGTGAIFGHPGDSDMLNPDSWGHRENGNAGDLPTPGSTLLIQRYIWGNEGIPGGGWDSGVSPVLNADISAFQLGDIYLAQAAAAGVVQTAQLDLVDGAGLSANNLLMGRVAGSSAVLNMSGNATASFGGFILPIDATASATINMNDSANLTFNALAGTTFWSIVMDADSVLTINNGLAGWANLNIAAKDAGDSILAVDLDGTPDGVGQIQYTVIPEPATIGLVSLAGGVLVMLRKRFTV